MARDRKRAKQRRERAAGAGARTRSAGALKPPRGPAEQEPSRSDVPAALDHASADVDEFDAALVRGAGGATADPEQVELEERDSEPQPVDDGAQDLLQTPAPADGGAGGAGDGDGAGRGGGGAGGGGERPEGERPSGAPLREGNRVTGFLRASWAELQRVQWPDRRQVTQATAVVVGFVAVAGAYLGLADYVAKEIVEVILG